MKPQQKKIKLTDRSLPEKTVGDNYKNKPAPRKFSEQFSSIIIELDRKSHPPQDNIVEWRSSPSSEPVDGFEVKRLGSDNVPAKISFNFNSLAGKFKINNPDLCQLLGISSPITKVSLTNDLVEDSSSDLVKSSPELKKIFGDIKIFFSLIPELLAPFCSPPDPLVLFYVIRVDLETEHRPPFAYDISVDFEEPIKSRLGILPSLQTGQKDLSSIEDQQQKLIQAIYNSRTKRDFLKGFCTNPVDFVNTLVENMTQDLLVITGEHKPGLELINSSNGSEQKKNLFDQAWADEAVFHYLIENDKIRSENQIVAETAALANPAAPISSNISGGFYTPVKGGNNMIHPNQ
ncbi:SWI/SNF-related matrix-associated actin-dependent regulator of chromatin subfamily D member 2 [Smittium mucronatum]|uniref:SWI/SNF-related matrix-associated actin-dependent regulator of chromatin subfamily D member 2 n=1 Tax=Smittium mucronatum TaxID=133383 RepID=A0A1R0H8Y3_9FUNG|nr:SWI/SNF-related matrix-associated actin-dependent regulator of chromatin subfamily D member 2 [Smittium mucronatum]